MAELKLKLREQLTAWVEYRLKTDQLDPPVLKVRLRPVDVFAISDAAPADGVLKVGRATLEIAMGAVAEWDLALDGKPIPVTDETKAAYLRPFMADPVEDRGGRPLAYVIFEDAQDQRLFLKN